MIVRMRDDLFDRVTIDGPLTSKESPELLEVLKEVIEAGRDLFLEIEGVSSIDLSGLQLLVAASEEFKRRRRGMALSKASPECMKLVESLGLEPFLYPR